LIYFRLIHARAILGTNLRLGSGLMASHIGQFEVETEWKPFLLVGSGIKVPLTSRLGLALDFGYLRSLDGAVALVPATLGLCF